MEHPITYTNVPKNKVVVNINSKKVILTVKERGIKLIGYRYINAPTPLVIDMSQLKQKIKNGKIQYYLPLNSVYTNIGKQLEHKSELVSVSPDTLFCELDDIAIKKIPVRIIISTTFEKQYGLYDKIICKPDSITIKGSKKLLENIHEIPTKKLVLSNMNTNYHTELPLQFFRTMQNIEYSNKSVNINLNIEKFTEGSVSVPVEGLNCPDGYYLKILPEKITLNYQVAFRDYHKIKPDQFKVIADYSKLNDINTRTIDIMIIKSPPNVQYIKSEQEKVEFILIKK
ncbi:MAG: hypothetical protein Q8880_03250 [Bacteroidota bacterium]|nr:hypothetical protein [Bacteroidota bacterium]